MYVIDYYNCVCNYSYDKCMELEVEEEWDEYVL